MKRPFRLAILIALAFAATAPLLLDGDAAAQKQAVTSVDLELVLAVDISRSMDEDEHTLQRDGYVSAFRHKDVINALTGGPEGRIAVTYMEWANDARQVIPWTIIDSAKAAHDFADRLGEWYRLASAGDRCVGRWREQYGWFGRGSAGFRAEAEDQHQWPADPAAHKRAGWLWRRL